MATYTITTTRAQEVGLKFSYDHYADKTLYPTQASWFQHQINLNVSDPMYAAQQHAMSESFDASFNTIPEVEQPAARVEIETVITTHGGTVVPAGGPVQPPVPPRAHVSQEAATMTDRTGQPDARPDRPDHDLPGDRPDGAHPDHELPADRPDGGAERPDQGLPDVGGPAQPKR